MSKPAVYLWREGASMSPWRPTTVSDIGKDEKFLEDLIVAHPDLLGLDVLNVPCKAYRQKHIVNAQDRTNIPDIIFLTANGDVVITEVKLSNNPELGDRRVISQIIDYAASLHAQKPETLLPLFQSDNTAAKSWPALVETLFPGVSDPRELADRVLHRLHSGAVHFVIACDRAPTGLYEHVKAVANLQAVALAFNVVEVRPYVCDDENSGVLFLANVKVKTEIVQHTRVTVAIEHVAPENVTAKVQVIAPQEDDEADAGDSVPHHTYAAELPDGTPIYVSRTVPPVAVIVNEHRGKHFSIVGWDTKMSSAKASENRQRARMVEEKDIWDEHKYGVPIDCHLIDKIKDLGETSDASPASTPRGYMRVVGE